ncbi:MAG: hypothetical protein HOP33_22860, partial [Verrucomicrobia bacterium]|nr:hypothetical protein [Verrucomicrobiota bacterium]
MHVRVLLAVNAALLGALTVASGETINFVGMPLTIELDPSHSVPTWVGYAGALVPTLNTTSPGSIVDNPASGSSYGRCIYYGNGNLAFDPSSFASYPGSWQAGDEYTFHFDGVVSNNTTFRMEFSNEAGAVGGLLGLQFEIVNGAFNGSDAIQIYSYGGTSTTLFNNANIGGAAGVGLPQRVIGNLTVTILNGTSASVSGSVADSLGNLWTGPSTTINLGTAPASLFAGVNLNSGAGVSGITTLSWSLTPDRFRLNLRTNGNGDLTRGPIETAYLSNSIVTLTATPNAGWAFMGWSDDASGTSNPLNVM